jgi:hypothetical protein
MSCLCTNIAASTDARLAALCVMSQPRFRGSTLHPDVTAPVLQICIPTTTTSTRRRNLLGIGPVTRFNCVTHVNSSSIGLSLSMVAEKDLSSRTGPLAALGVPTTPGKQSPWKWINCTQSIGSVNQPLTGAVATSTLPGHDINVC